ncbi:MAG TPA: YdeI/OmpD-associated family protein [Ginsengibacter sp.]|nr:YdeI/OmpD-associated family protein [Chitinophagaceae bacterium]HRN73896.1 YdeI/OmpD-associated family protein [Ginsengibacter sp.]HRP18062.1 YdeI/OmpD-associated family protein [Ginsengibacter sp.]HRP44536.1 YdeI/OmpD-associated family protein [Ginsengibacter sp.]
MTSKVKIANGILHKVPANIHEILATDSLLRDTWNSLTAIQRNEWICWVTIPKKAQTQVAHLTRMVAEIKEGKKQPCCWPGCPHRNPNAKKWFGKSDHQMR